MSVLVTLFDLSPYLIFPGHWIGWLGLAVLCCGIAALLWHWRRYNPLFGATQWIFLMILILLTPLTSLFFGLQLPSFGALPPPGLPIAPQGSALMFLAALPWFIAAGILGPTAATILAAFSGLLLGLWNTHSLFTSFEIALLAGILAVAVNQHFKTWVFRVFRHPSAVALLLIAIYPMLFLVDSTLFLLGISPDTSSIVISLDYAITHTTTATLAFAGEVIVAGIFSQILAVALPKMWGRRPSADETVDESFPPERSLEARFFFTMGPLFLMLAIALIAGGWIVVGNVARQMLRERMALATQTASDSIHFFLEAGQDLVLQMAQNPAFYTSSPEALPQILQDSFYTLPFFQQLIYLDTQGKVVSSFPAADYRGTNAPLDEAMGIDFALNGVVVQSYPIPPGEGEQAARIAFIAAVQDESDQVRGVLIGRTNLATNPFTRPIIATLDSMLDVNGEGFLLDENGQILYHHSPELLMTTYNEPVLQDGPHFFDQNAGDGTRHLVLYQTTVGRPWAVVMSVPARRVQQLALNIALPLLGIILVALVIAVILLQLGLHMIITSLQTLAVEADRITQGQLDHALTIGRQDEIGQLRHSFEKMRQSLKARLDDLKHLLNVSQEIAATLDIRESVLPILEAALESGACAVHIILDPAIMPELDGINNLADMLAESGGVVSASTQPQWCFRLGSDNEPYSYLDDQFLALLREKDQIIITNPSRARVLNYERGVNGELICPQALIAEALRHENLYYGAFWVAYDQPRQFTDEEIGFLKTLASQAALAASNARLFLNAEIGRQRLAAILNSTPDPVLVTDQRNRLLLANPAAWQVLGLGLAPEENKPIEEVIMQPSLLELLKLPDDRQAHGRFAPDEEMQSVEVIMPGERVYLATASSIAMDGQRIGRVCILQDVTHFKALDSLKSEFVSTVSHDLRSPLSLVRGYATMLEMVGELNEQQTNYVRKIMSGIESMARLVNNLLDLGRIEAGVGLQLEMVSVQNILETVVGAFQLQATQRKIQLSTELVPDGAQTPLIIEADQALLQQALNNLVENALKYTEQGGKVHVRAECVPTETKGQGVLFAVRDTGIGIAPVDQVRLFEKFYRVARRGKVEQRGTGLGLAIVKSIAERHQGIVWVESQLGKGSVFYLLIPAR